MLKEKWQSWSRISLAIGKFLSRFPFPPNFYTWLTVFPAVFGLIAVVRNQPIFGFTFFLISGLLDIVDGSLARYTNKTTTYGAFLDGSLDRLVDLLLLFSYFWLPLYGIGLSVEKWICLGCFGMIMPSFEVAYANHRGLVPDPTETIIWRILNRGEMYPLMLAIVLFSQWSAMFASYLLVIFVVLSAITTIQTFVKALSYGRRLEEVDCQRCIPTMGKPM